MWRNVEAFMPIYLLKSVREVGDRKEVVLGYKDAQGSIRRKGSAEIWNRTPINRVPVTLNFPMKETFRVFENCLNKATLYTSKYVSDKDCVKLINDSNEVYEVFANDFLKLLTYHTYEEGIGFKDASFVFYFDDSGVRIISTKDPRYDELSKKSAAMENLEFSFDTLNRNTIYTCKNGDKYVYLGKIPSYSYEFTDDLNSVDNPEEYVKFIGAEGVNLHKPIYLKDECKRDLASGYYLFNNYYINSHDVNKRDDFNSILIEREFAKSYSSDNNPLYVKVTKKKEEHSFLCLNYSDLLTRGYMITRDFDSSYGNLDIEGKIKITNSKTFLKRFVNASPISTDIKNKVDFYVKNHPLFSDSTLKTFVEVDTKNVVGNAEYFKREINKERPLPSFYGNNNNSLDNFKGSSFVRNPENKIVKIGVLSTLGFINNSWRANNIFGNYDYSKEKVRSVVKKLWDDNYLSSEDYIYYFNKNFNTNINDIWEFPAFCIVEDGKIISSEYTIKEVFELGGIDINGYCNFLEFKSLKNHICELIEKFVNKNNEYLYKLGYRVGVYA